MRALGIAASALLFAACAPRTMGAAAIVRPLHLPVAATDLPHQDLAFQTEDGLTLRGWVFRPPGPSKGVVVFLHGKDNTRRMGLEAARRFVPRGWTVFLYDQRAHGLSDGTFMTYGAREKDDLRRALDAVGAKRAVAMGMSLGAAVALMAAPEDERIIAVAALASFSDLDGIIREKAGPLALNEALLRDSIRDAEHAADFKVSDVSPREAAAKIRVPVLIVHGTRDAFTNISHSRRIYDAVTAPRRLMVVQGATHYDLTGFPAVWDGIERWFVDVVDR